jgi:surface antigen Omp85-like protein
MSPRSVWIFAAFVAQAMLPSHGRAQNADDRPLVVEGLQCRGAESTSCAYILSHVQLRAGEPIDEEELRNATFRLQALPNFTSVRIYLERGSERGNANVVVEVTEAKPLLAEGLFRIANNGSNELGGRVSHQNLLGSGERLDFSAIVRSPAGGPLERDSEYALLQYVDPNIFANGRYFLIAGVADNESTLATRYGDEFRGEATHLSLSLGRRIGDFSYLALRYGYFHTGHAFSSINRPDGSIDIDDVTFSRSLVVDYGWNSEDDPYFPTQGGRFNASLGFTPLDSHFSTDPEKNGDTGTAIGLGFGYRHTWSFAPQRFWTFAFGAPGTESRSDLDEGFLFSFGHARSLPTGGMWSGVRRGRWYVEGGWNWLGLGEGREVQEAGIEVGLRLNTKSFGMVELSLRATTETE